MITDELLSLMVCPCCAAFVGNMEKHMRAMHPGVFEKPPDPLPVRDEWLVNNLSITQIEERDYIAKRLKDAWDKYDNPASIQRELFSLFRAAGLEG